MERFRNILCVADLGKGSRAALTRAAKVAQDHQADLTIVDVVPEIVAGTGLPGGEEIVRLLGSQMHEEYEQRLRSLVEPLEKELDVRWQTLSGIPFLEIIRQVIRNDHDLLIKCPESPDWLDRLFTGDDMHLLRKCPCPVWLVKPETDTSFDRILAAVDVSDACRPGELQTRQALNLRVLDVAATLAVSEFAELDIVHVWEAPGESTVRQRGLSGDDYGRLASYLDSVQGHRSRLLDELLATMRASLGEEAADFVRPRAHLTRGYARRDIPQMAARLGADCIVMGTVARTGIPGFFMGNTAETILEQIDCSVMAVKPPGFASPVDLDA